MRKLRKSSKKSVACCNCIEGPCVTFDIGDKLPCSSILKFDIRKYIEISSPESKALTRLKMSKDNIMMSAKFLLYNKT